FGAPVALLIGTLAWVNNPFTRVVAPDISTAISYVPLGVGGLALAVGALFRQARVRSIHLLPADIPCVALGALLALGAFIGVLRNNAPVYLAGDAAQIAEFLVFYFIGSRLVRNRRESYWLMAAIGLCTLASTATDLVDF